MKAARNQEIGAQIKWGEKTGEIIYGRGSLVKGPISVMEEVQRANKRSVSHEQRLNRGHHGDSKAPIQFQYATGREQRREKPMGRQGTKKCHK